mgnify:CR=1 FL=1
MKKNKRERVSFDKYYAPVMYEWWLALKQLHHAYEWCEHCTMAAEKLEGCLGEKEVRRLKGLVKKNPYKLLVEGKPDEIAVLGQMICQAAKHDPHQD